MKDSKSYDSVKEMRRIREQLSERYWKNPEELMADLEKVRKKYKLRPRKRSAA